MKHSTLGITLFLLTLSVVMADTPKEHHECPAPIGVMGEHQHKAGEMMLGYRFMIMNMQGLQSGSDAVETADVLRDFMMAPTTMVMRMHMFGAMYAPHDKITTNPYFMTHSDTDWKESVMVTGGGAAVIVTIAGIITTIPVWITVTGAVCSGIVAGTAIWEWVDNDCKDCIGSGCPQCDSPDDDDCDDCDGSGGGKCLHPPMERPYDEYVDHWNNTFPNYPNLY